MKLKRCSKCNNELPATEEYFYTQKGRLVAACKECSRKKANEYIYRDYEAYLTKQREYQRRIKDKMHGYARSYYEKCSHKRKEYSKKWVERNRDKVRQYSSERQHKNHRISTWEWNKCKLYFGSSCAYCGMTEKEHRELYNQDLHKEHIDHQGSNDLSNCVPSCKICNSKKHTKTLDDWYNHDNPVFDETRFKLINIWLCSFK